MPDDAGLDIVIVAYQCRDLLRDCLASLREHPAGLPTSIRVVDNASGDGTADMVSREFAEVELTRLDENRGFAAANNLAIAAGSAPSVLVLNPDTKVTEGALATLLERIAAEPAVGICGPRLERPDGSFDHAARRAFPTPVSALGHFTGIGRRMDRGPLAAYRAPGIASGPVDAVNGASMLIRRRALDEVGLFDEGYWMYMEDLDLCYRFAEAGWITWFEPAATVIHVKAGTSGPIRSPRLNYAFHYGMYRFYRSHYAPQRSPMVNAAVYAGIGAKLIASVTRGMVARLTRYRHAGATREHPR